MKKTLLFVAALAFSLGMSAQTVLEFEGELPERSTSVQTQASASVSETTISQW